MYTALLGDTIVAQNKDLRQLLKKLRILFGRPRVFGSGDGQLVFLAGRVTILKRLSDCGNLETELTFPDSTLCFGTEVKP